jgi:hypothetical protein
MQSEAAMIEYRFRMPRVAVGCAAMTMTALTLGLLVILPARMEDASQPPATLAWSGATIASIGARVQLQVRRWKATLARRGLDAGRQQGAAATGLAGLN